MHIVEEKETIAGRRNVVVENGEDFLVDRFMLGIADRIFPIIVLFAVIVETKRAGIEVQSRWDLREETLAKEGFT